MRFNNSTQPKGLTFIEIVIGMTLLLALITIMGTLVSSYSIVRKIKFKQEAYALAAEQLDVHRSLNYGALINQNNKPFGHILYPKGSFIITDDAAQSGTQSILSSGHSGTTGITAIIIPPIGNFVADGTITSYIRIPSSTPTPWKAGIIFRAQDEQNMYVATISNSTVELLDYTDSVSAVLFTSPQSLNVDTWYKFAVVASSNTFDIFLDDVKLNGSSIVDSSYDVGFMAIATYNGTDAFIDSVSYKSLIDVYSWNFDNVQDLPGNSPLDWIRSSIYSLPNVQTELTISNEEADVSSPLKNVTATVSWNDNSSQSITLETYVAETGITK